MAKPRRYRQFCGCARALDVIGERWTLLLVRDLLLGPRRYRDLLEGLPGMTTNLLAKRLREMVDHGLIEKISLPPPASGSAYQLTALGQELEPVVLAVGRFGARYLDAPKKGDAVNLRWGLVSLKRRYQGGIAGLTVELRLGPKRFTLRLDPTSLSVQERAAEKADLTLTLEEAKFREAMFTRQGRTLEALRTAGDLVVEGSDRNLAKFATAFPL
jgi:DNA-binding HxlR family transcriptional regulator